jgi:hypothetical protein
MKESKKRLILAKTLFKLRNQARDSHESLIFKKSSKNFRYYLAGYILGVTWFLDTSDKTRYQIERILGLPMGTTLEDKT